MKKVGIITCHNIKNYGSVFQTYATIKIFSKLGYKVEVIDYKRPGTDEYEFRRKIKSESHFANKPIFKLIFPKILDASFNKMQKIFSDFIKNNISLTELEYHTEKELIENLPDEDIFVSGSDQIWNSSINGDVIRPYFLSFVPNDKPKISFASSFGKTELSPYEKNETKKLLSRYNFITTREESGARIVNELGLSAKSILDPTLWLKTNEWDIIAEKINTPPRYILVYQLHKNTEMEHYIKKIKSKYKMPCLRIDLYYHYIIKKGRHVFCPTPGQVISLVKKATYIITDSFHMTVFSVLYNKKFVSIYSENSYSDRIEHILNLLGLEKRHLVNFKDYETLKSEIDYQNVNFLLDEKRKDLQNWLIDAMREVEKNILN